MPMTKEKAARELASMKRSLKSWLKFRDKNDALGLSPEEKIQRGQAEAPLVTKMQELLTAVHGSVSLPADARELALVVVENRAFGPAAQGFLPILVGGAVLLLVVSTWIKNWADVAKERERYQCIAKSGAFACDPSGTMLKYGVVLGVGYLIWTKTDLQKHLKGVFGRVRGRRR